MIWSFKLDSQQIYKLAITNETFFKTFKESEFDYMSSCRNVILDCDPGVDDAYALQELTYLVIDYGLFLTDKGINSVEKVSAEF